MSTRVSAAAAGTPSARLRPSAGSDSLPPSEIRITGWLVRDAVRATAADGTRSTVDLVISQGGKPPIHAQRVYAGGTANYQSACALAARLRAGQRISVWGHHLTAGTRNGSSVLVLQHTHLIDCEDPPRGAST